MNRPSLLAGRPLGTILQTVTPSSPEASLPSARPAGPCDPEASRVPQYCPPPALAGAPMGTLGCSRPDSFLSPRLPKQVTLSTLSRPRFGLSHFYLRVHPEKEGGKKSRGDPSQLERKNFKRVSTAAKKPRLCRPSNDNKAFRRAQGDGFPPRSDQKPGTLGHITLLQAERTPLYHRRPPSWRWANTQALMATAGQPAAPLSTPSPPDT